MLARGLHDILLICHMYPYVNCCTLNIEMLPLTNFWVDIMYSDSPIRKHAHPDPQKFLIYPGDWKGVMKGSSYIFFFKYPIPKKCNDDPTFSNDTRPPDCKEMPPVFQTSFQHNSFNQVGMVLAGVI